jgi:hypothetical protein
MRDKFRTSAKLSTIIFKVNCFLTENAGFLFGY